MKIRKMPITTFIVEISVEEILALGDSAYMCFCDQLEDLIRNICGHYDWDFVELDDCYIRITQPLSQEELELVEQQLVDRIMPIVHRTAFEVSQEEEQQ